MRIGITGGSGSLGSALIERLVSAGIGPIVTMTRDELKAQRMSDKYGGVGGDVRVMLIADGLNNTQKLEEAFGGCEVVVHAAAMKRISESVYSSGEMIQTNVEGTRHVLEAATQAGVGKVLFISSDKASAPINAYGGSKFLAECLAVQHNSFSYPRGTRVSVARWGNVLGSRGSVLWTWRAQAAKGDPLHVTHKDMTRFIVTMDQAVSFVLACIFSMRGGEIFLPILPSAYMVDLAKAVAPDAPIHIDDQLRPGGEKLNEQLLNEEEPRRTLHRKLTQGWGRDQHPCYVVTPSHRTWSHDVYPGKPVAHDLRYRSDINEQWLNVEDLTRLIAEVPNECDIL